MKRLFKKGFTLVELIVVITILAILGTIAFLSLQGYSNDARNSKRISDITNIETAAATQVSLGRSLISFMIGDSLAIIPNHSIAGRLSISSGSSQDYNAGKVNYIALGLKKEDFQDPKGNQDYAFGASIRADGKYQIAAKMEQGGGAFTVKVKGNHKPRKITNNLITIVGTGTNNTVNIGINDIGKLIAGDTIDTSRGNSTGSKVERISGDGKTLILSSPVTSLGTLGLAQDETDGLIDAGGSLTGVVVTDGANFFPY